MKSSLLSCFIMMMLLSIHFQVFGQGVSVNGAQQGAHSSAILDISSSEKGLLIPRMSQIARESILQPPEGLWVYQVDGQEGLYQFNGTQWSKFSNQSYDNIPIGGIIDWMPYSQSLPSGFLICDGSMVTDTESPFYNTMLPDLNDKFVMTVPLDQLGTVGGSSEHDHGFSNQFYQTTSANATHNHTIGSESLVTNIDYHDHYYSVQLVPSVSYETHGHKWSKFTANENWWSFVSNGSEEIMVNWTNGVDAGGSGEYPIAVYAPGGASSTTTYYTSKNTHSHSFNQIPTFALEDDKSHLHTVDLPGVGESKNEVHDHRISFWNYKSSKSNHLPQHIKLMKIIRVK